MSRWVDIFSTCCFKLFSEGTSTGSETEGFSGSTSKMCPLMLHLRHWFLSSYSWLVSQHMLGTNREFSGPDTKSMLGKLYEVALRYTQNWFLWLEHLHQWTTSQKTPKRHSKVKTARIQYLSKSWLVWVWSRITWQWHWAIVDKRLKNIHDRFGWATGFTHRTCPSLLS